MSFRTIFCCHCVIPTELDLTLVACVSIDFCVSFPLTSMFPGIFGNQQNHYLDVIKQMLGQSLQLRSAPQVGMAYRLVDVACRFVDVTCGLMDAACSLVGEACRLVDVACRLLGAG